MKFRSVQRKLGSQSGRLFCCRKKKSTHKSEAALLNGLGKAIRKLDLKVNPGIEEVNMFQKDGKVIHIPSPQGGCEATDSGGDYSALVKFFSIFKDYFNTLLRVSQ